MGINVSWMQHVRHTIKCKKRPVGRQLCDSWLLLPRAVIRGTFCIMHPRPANAGTYVRYGNSVSRTFDVFGGAKIYILVTINSCKNHTINARRARTCATCWSIKPSNVFERQWFTWDWRYPGKIKRDQINIFEKCLPPTRVTFPVRLMVVFLALLRLNYTFSIVYR